MIRTQALLMQELSSKENKEPMVLI